MKKILALVLIACMVMGFGAGFALEDPEPLYELDERVTPFVTIGSMELLFVPGDVKYLSNGNVALQGWIPNEEVPQFIIAEVTRDGQLLEDRIAIVLDRPFEDMEVLLWNYLFEDAAGDLYTSGLDALLIEQGISTAPLQAPPGAIGMVQIAPNFTDVQILFVEEMADFLLFNNMFFGSNDINAKGHGLINVKKRMFEEEGEVAFMTYEDDWTLSGHCAVASVASVSLAEKMDEFACNIIGADFGSSDDEAYLLVDVYGSPFEDPELKIVKLDISWIQEEPGVKPYFDYSIDDIIDTDLELGTDLISEEIAIVSFKYDGSGFQVLYSDEMNLGTVYKLNKSGVVSDSVALPGIGLKFDTLGSETIVSLLAFGETEDMGFYKIDWGTDSMGTPSRLINERSVGEKTTATYRDGGFGLLRTKEDETGKVDYLAPLRTKDNDVRLRIPLADVLAKLGDNARNLVILFGYDRISIPMTALGVQDLLAQMPCETDATVEIHLVRGDDGSVKVTADLFVVEQVDDMTKVVHRLPIVMP
jgi:hypothetical protein